MPAIRSLLAVAALATLPVPAPSFAPAVEPVTATAGAPVEAVRVTPRAAARTVAPSPTRRSARPAAAPGAMFRTPEAAMRYLAAAYNRHDLVALKHVTTPSARHELEDMRGVAPRLRLESCEWYDATGAYSCTFAHTYPGKPGLGEAVLRVAPARKPGWYATVTESCG